MKIILITGCSSGFGYLAALKFARNGWKVFASVKSLDERSKKLQSTADKEKLDLEVVKIDVTKQNEIDFEVQKILKANGHIDVLINNAGFGYFGPLEEFDIEQIQEQYDVNIFGALRMIQAVLPSMRQRKSGRIINVTSLNGLLSFGLYGVYSSSKFALETMSEVLRFEVKPFGVDVTVVEPGAFLTDFQNHSKVLKGYKSGKTAYSGLRNPLDRETLTKEKVIDNPIIKRIVDPQHVVNKLFEIANLPKTRIRYKIGIDTKLYTFVRKITPDSIWEAILHKAYKW